LVEVRGVEPRSFQAI